jgi:hypothetical protein
VQALLRFTERGRWFPSATFVPFVGQTPEVGVGQAVAVLRRVAPVALDQPAEPDAA